MAGRKENLKALFSNTRTRIIILFTVAVILVAVIVGVIKLNPSSSPGSLSTADLSNAPVGIQSIPGALNPTAQYASLQEEQNVNQAVRASKVGGSAIPTIIRTQAFGQGVQAVGPQGGAGGAGFETLAREDLSGPQQSLWLQSLKDSDCSKASLDRVMAQGAALTDVKDACTCLQLKDNGYQLSDLQSVCSCKDLKAAGFDALQLKNIGDTATQLRQCGFDACALRGAGFSAQAMKDAGFSDGELKGAGFVEQDIGRASGLPDGVTAQDVRSAGCQVTALSHLRTLGVSAAAIQRISGCGSAQLKAAGFSAENLKAAGFSAAELSNAGFTPAELRQAGYSARDLLNAGFTPKELSEAGYTPAQVKAAETELPPGVTMETLKDAGCAVGALERARLAGVSAGILHQYVGCDAHALKEAGFTAGDLANAGFSPAQISSAQSSVPEATIRAAGCDVLKLKSLSQQGVSAERIHALNGCDAQQLKEAGYDAASLKKAGFSPEQLVAAGFTPAQIRGNQLVDDAAIRAAGCDPQKLHMLFEQGVSANRIHDLNGCNAQGLKQAGYDAKELTQAGFTPAQLLASGFTPAEVRAGQPVSDNAVRAAGCDPQALRGLLLRGVSARRIHDLNGCSAQTLKDVGYGAMALTDAGFTPHQLITAGFTPEQIKAAQVVDAAAVRAAGCDPTQLKRLFSEGVSAERIRTLSGCSAEALKNAGYSAAKLADAGYTPQQLLSAGFTPAQVREIQPVDDSAIRAAGCDPQKLQSLFAEGVDAKRIHALNGCNAQALKSAGFDATELADAGFTPTQLLAAGFTPQQVNATQPPDDNTIRAAGCDATALHALFQQGVSATRVHDLNGCSAAALKQAGYDAAELTDAGFTPQQLLGAGFQAAQIRALQPIDDGVIKAAGCDPQKLQALYLQGVSAERIHALNGCGVNALKAAGFGVRALTDAGFTPQQLLADGFTPAEVSAAQALVGNEAVHAAGCNPVQLRKLAAEGVSAKRIHDLNGCTAGVLKEAGFDARLLRDAGFTPQQLLAAGFTPAQLAASQLANGAALQTPGAEGGGDAAAIQQAGCDPKKLHVLFEKGITAKQIHQENGCGVDALKQAGYDVQNLADAGFTPQQLLADGFTPQQLMQASLSPTGVIAAGRTASCSESSLQAAHALGVSATTIKQTLGCDASALKQAGYTASELKDAGFSAAQLKNAGFDAQALKQVGFTAKELDAAGYTAAQLKQAGFNLADLKEAGFSASTLKNFGFSADALRKAGFTAKELKEAGFSAVQLKKAGYSIKDLEEAGFSPQDSALADLQQVAQTPSLSSPVAPLPSFAGAPDQAKQTEANNAKQLQAILKRQQGQMADQRYQQKIQQRTGAMIAAANQALQGWQVAPVQAYVGGSVPDKTIIGKESTTEVTVDSLRVVPQEAADGSLRGKMPLIKAGDVLFAVLDTSVNSDEPGPILATVVSGKLQGAKLIGSFNLPSNADKMVISFNTMSVPGAPKTTSINAYAIDPNTARTALSSQTDHHYLLRYGSLFAATFIEGFGNAFQSANTTIQIGGSGGAMNNTTITNGVGRSVLENAVIGLATLGKSWGQVAQQQFNTPTTVDVFSGTGIGVLFTQDLASL